MSVKYSRRAFLRLVAASAVALPIIFLGVDRLISRQNEAQKKSPYPLFNAVDKFGIKEFYPTKQNGLEWFADWDKDRTVANNSFDPYDNKFGLGSGKGLIIGEGIARIRSFDGSHRLFVKGPWLNTEQTVYIKVLPNGTASSIQLRSRSNHHGIQYLPYPDVGYSVNSDSTIELNSCGFGNYIVKWGQIQLDFVSIELELMHPIYSRGLIVEPFTMPKNEYIGFKTVTRTLQNGLVKLEGYNNLDVSSQSNWIKTIEYLFNGANAAVPDSTLVGHLSSLDFCKDKGDKISGDLNNHQIWNKPSYWNWIRINNAVNVDLKNYSVREIQQNE